jgi:hypothetical protein
MNLFPQRQRAVVLGLSLDADRLEGVVVHRGNDRVAVRNAFNVALSLNPLTNEAQLVGREIRQHLDRAGIRVRKCVVCIPTHWVLSLQVKLPDLPEPDLAGFLQLEAERGFPYSPEALMLGESRFKTPGGEAFATLMAVPRDHVDRLIAALTEAQLKPVALSLGIAALQPCATEDATGVIALVPGSQGISLQVTCGGGVAMLRSIEGIYEAVGTAQQLQADPLLRELRITLGQLPSSLRESVRRIRVFGRGDKPEELHEELQLRTPSWGMRLEWVSDYAHGGNALPIPHDTPVSPCVSLAVRHLLGERATFDFLPPRVTAWQRVSARYSSRKLLWAGAGAAALAAIPGIAFLVQQALLWKWESRWEAMATRVSELESLQQRVREYRPWFAETYRSLNALRRLAEAFPENGSVFARSVELREPSTILCRGTAQDRQSLLAALKKLGEFEEVGELKVERMEGSPIEFSFYFQWVEAGAP